MHSLESGTGHLRAACHDIIQAIEALDRVDHQVGVANWTKVRGELINTYLDCLYYMNRPFDQEGAERLVRVGADGSISTGRALVDPL